MWLDRPVLQGNRLVGKLLHHTCHEECSISPAQFGIPALLPQTEAHYTARPSWKPAEAKQRRGIDNEMEDDEVGERSERNVQKK
jgi:hypothetical protein